MQGGFFLRFKPKRDRPAFNISYWMEPKSRTDNLNYGDIYEVFRRFFSHK